MSHFTVLVIGPDVERQLAPYHEFGSTGRVDEYVLSEDITAKARADYESETRRRLRAPDGALRLPWDEEFYREFTPEEIKRVGNPMGMGTAKGILWDSRHWSDGKGYRAKVQFVPDGYAEVVVPVAEVETFDSFVEEEYGVKRVEHGCEPDMYGEHKFGWYRVDAAGEVSEVVNRDNPNRKWDWWRVGGRWRGFFRLKESAPDADYFLDESGGLQKRIGDPGTFESISLREMSPIAREAHMEKYARRADVTPKGDVDIDAMRDTAGVEAGKTWDRLHTIIAGRDVESWKSVRARFEIDGGPECVDRARESYWAQEVLKDLRADRELWHYNLEDWLIERDVAIQRARDGALSTFAVVMNGSWYERGEMGWFGCVSDEKDEDHWNREFAALFDSLPDETLLTIVDCHI